MRVEFGKYIVVDDEICHGKPTFKGTRVLVSDIIELLATGLSIKEIIRDYYPSMPKFLFYEKNLRKYRLYNPEKDGKDETLESAEEGIPYSKISGAGQLYLPSSIQKELNVKPGDIVVFQKNNRGEIMLKKGKLIIEVE